MDIVYPAAASVLVPSMRLALRWTIEGDEHIPVRGGVILASNHVSYLDPFVLGFVANRRHRRVRFLAKSELFEKRGLGAVLRGAHQIPVMRGRADANGALRAAVDALFLGECVAIFPEGTISLDLEPMRGKSGTARLAQAAATPIVPIGLWGTHRILMKHRKPNWEWGVAEVAVVGAPLTIEPDEHVRTATDRVMDAITTLVAKAREIYPQRPAAHDDDWWWRDPESAGIHQRSA
jgi:1-acyl-sn-glycerol-3-phosphate acyltransferase